MMPLPEGLTEHVVCGRAAPIERKVWTARSVGERPGIAVLFLDAELYLERVGAAEVVEQLRRDGTLPPSRPPSSPTTVPPPGTSTSPAKWTTPPSSR